MYKYLNFLFKKKQIKYIYRYSYVSSEIAYVENIFMPFIYNINIYFIFIKNVVFEMLYVTISNMVNIDIIYF